MRESSFFHWEKRNVTGVSMIIRMWRNGAENLAIVSGDHDSGYDRGNRRTGVAAEKLDKKHRGKGAESDVDDVVADENRGEQLVKVLQQL